jgi:predicted nucleic acid-binding protein
LITHPQRSAQVLAITDWLASRIMAGDRIIVPAIVHFELKRELIRANKATGLERLQKFVGAMPGRYLPLSDEALQLAAEFWARARKQGRPTADVKDLDVDVILAAQALSFGPATQDIVVATTNEKHLSQFVTAREWTRITS